MVSCELAPCKWTRLSSLKIGPDSYSYHNVQHCAELIKSLSKNLVNWFFILPATCVNVGRSRISGKLTARHVGKLLFPVSDNITQSSKKEKQNEIRGQMVNLQSTFVIQDPGNQREKETKTCRVQIAVLEFLRVVCSTHITSKATTTFSFRRRVRGILWEDHLTLLFQVTYII